MRTAILTALILSAAPSSSLRADVIYSDFFTGTYNSNTYTNAFNTGGGHQVSGSNPSLSFTASISENLSEVDFVASIGVAGDTNAVVISISTAPGNAAGPTLLESQEIDGEMGVLGVNSGIIAWNPTTPINLIGGTTYYVTLSAPGADVTWNDNILASVGQPPAYGDYTYNSGSGTWQPVGNTLGAVEILGGAALPSSAPEPGTVFLLGSGFLAVAGLKLRRRRRSE